MSRLRPAPTLLLVIQLVGCASLSGPRCAPDEQPMVASLLYFGTATPDGVVSDADWSAFLQEAITPRFPDGLTVWPASGQWRSGDGEIIREDSHVLNLLHPRTESAEAAIAGIIADYKSRFRQESVLRVQSPVCAAF